MNRYRDRKQAGEVLAGLLAANAYRDPVILALPRGGVPVALEICRRLNAPLDLIMVRKIGVPGHEELAAAAIVDGPEPQLVVNEDVVAMAGLDTAGLQALAKAELKEIARRRAVYLKGRKRIGLQGRTAIVVDDGIATGATVRAALTAIRALEPARLVLAVPVAPPDTVARLKAEVDDLICPLTPSPFGAIGAFYDRFDQVPDDSVIRDLDEAARISAPQP